MPHFKETVRVEVDKSVIDKVEHGQEVEMKLAGRISALESREIPDFEEKSEEEEAPKKTVHEIGLEVDRVRVSPRTEFADLVDEGDDD